MTLPHRTDEHAHRQHFLELSNAEQRAAVKRLADSGLSDYGIAAATGLSVEMVRTIVGERAARQ